MGYTVTRYKCDIDGVCRVLRDGEMEWLPVVTKFKTLQQVNVPDISRIHSAKDLYSLLDVSAPETYIDMVDKSFYMLMSKTEFTEGVYRMSAFIMDRPVEIVKGILSLT